MYVEVGRRARRVVLVVEGRPSAPSRKITLLLSQRPSLRNTVMSAGAPDACEGAPHGAEVDRQERVAVGHQERRRRARPDPAPAAARPPVPRRSVPSSTTRTREPEARAVADVVAQHVAPVADRQHDVGHAVAGEPVELVVDERPPATGISALGMVSVSGRMRVARPPARITHCMGRAASRCRRIAREARRIKTAAPGRAAARCGRWPGRSGCPWASRRSPAAPNAATPSVSW